MKVQKPKMELSPDQLASRYERLRNEEMYKDVTLTSHDNVVSAHKCVLTIGSQFFDLLFQQAERKQDIFQRSSFELVGLTVEVASHLDAVVDFLYSGIIYINETNFPGIIKLADYLAIEELFDLGERYIEKYITKENCLKLYLDLKKGLNEDSSKSTCISSTSNRKTDNILKLAWEAVETNFYGYIIDHHEFLEVIPVEVEQLLMRNFVTQKVLNLAVRWMKTWPLGFTFAESLINIAYCKLDAARQEDLTEKCKTDVVDSVRTIKELVRSRTVPKSIRENMLKKLKEIQKAFDEKFEESDKEKETEISKSKTDTKETVAEAEDKLDKENNGFDKTDSLNNTEEVNDKDNMEKEKNEVKSKMTGNGSIDCENAGKESQEDNLVKTEEDLELFGSNSGVNQKPMNDSKPDDDKIVSNGNRVRTIIGETLNEIKDDTSCSMDSVKEESTSDNHMNVKENVDTMEIPEEDKATEMVEEVQLLERKKLDGTEEEVQNSISDDSGKSPNMCLIDEEPASDSNAQDELDTDRSTLHERVAQCLKGGTDLNEQDDVGEVHTTLHDRVAECLKLQRVVKAENGTNASQLTKVKPSRRKRKRGRPKRYVVEEEAKEIYTPSTRRTRGIKRKIPDTDLGLSGSENDETVVKVEVENERDETDAKDIQTNEEMADGTDLDWDKEYKSDEDSDEDGSEKVFAEALKKAGIDMQSSGARKPTKKRTPRKSGHHECEVCNKVYSQKYRLTQHMNMHLGIKPYKCVVCVQCFTRTDHVVRHMKTQHNDMDMYKCNECDEEFDKANEMVSHSITHLPQNNDNEEKLFTETEKEYINISTLESGKPQYSCTKCNQTFRRPYQAREHVNFHTGEKPFKCRLCDYSCAKKENLTNHIKSVHDGKKGDHQCSKCRKFFMKKENYDAHVEKCEPNYVCDKCPMKFFRKTHLDNHAPVHDLLPQHKCPHCENVYRYRKHMSRHVRKDHLNVVEAIPCVCDICGVVLKNKDGLYRHKKVHKTPDKECDVCGKAFKDNTTLKDHKLMHSNIRDYQCEICSMLFARKGNLIRHQKRHRGERKYRCEICGMCFVANCDLTRHKNTHFGVKKFPCRYCGRKFGLKSKVVVHERTHTGERPYICRDEGCGKTFKQTGDRVRHEKKVHSLTYNKYMTLYELATGESEDIYKGCDGLKLPNKVVTLPVNASLEGTPANSSVDQATSMDVSTERVENGGLNQSANVTESYMEEAEMSKIFQRTVAAISQEAIANSGVYN